MKRAVVVVILLTWVFSPCYSQSVKKFTLEQAQEFALKNNYDIKNAKTDIEIARKRVKESLAIGLPQINGRISNTNYIDIPTQLIPDFITPVIYNVNINDFGLEPTQPLGDIQFFPAQFGTEYNASAEVSASQLIFSGQYIVGVKTAKTFLEKTRMEYVKDELDVKEAVSRSYYYTLVAEENQEILESNLEVLKQLAEQTRETYELGFIEETEADQMDILVANLEANLINLNNQIEIAYASLKHTLGLELSDEIELTEDLNKRITILDHELLLKDDFNFNKNIDYKILIKQKEIMNSQIRLEQSTYLPTLSAFFTAQTSAMRSKYNFFDGDQPWYPSTFWGIEMNIPIFSSGNRAAKVQKAKLQLRQMNELDKKLKNGLNIAVNTAKNNFYNSYLLYKNKKNNMELADRIYKRDQEKFQEGIASSMDLLQTHNQYFTAEAEYINALLNLFENKIELEKLLATED